MKQIRLLTALGLGLSLAATPAALLAATAHRYAPAVKAPPETVDPDAMQALQRMSNFLMGLNSFKLESQTSLDVVTAQGQRLQLDGVTRYRVRRPDSFVIEVVSDLKQRTFYYDGKTFTLVAPKLGYYATAPAPPTIRATLDRIRDRFGISLPLEDLFRWNDPANRSGREPVTSGYKVGTATIDGVETDQYAFREGKIDWQVWIQQGDQPLPRKLVIVDRTDPANPGYTARLSWTLNPPLTAADFAFTPGPNLKPIQFTASAGQ
jgi:hypothetical protein